MSLPLFLMWLRGGPCEAGTCVEVASVGEGVAVRDSKDQNGPILRFTPQEWAAFLAGAKAGEFDHLP